MIRKMPWPEIAVIMLVLTVGGGVFLYAHKDEDSLEESKRRGADIVRALAEYRTDLGTYPDQLSTLVPDYIDAVEPPTWGVQQWRYRTYAAGSTAVQEPVQTPSQFPVQQPVQGPVQTPPQIPVRQPPQNPVQAPIQQPVPEPVPRAVVRDDERYFQLSVAANESGYPVLYYDFRTGRWVLNN